MNAGFSLSNGVLVAALPLPLRNAFSPSLRPEALASAGAGLGPETGPPPSAAGAALLVVVVVAVAAAAAAAAFRSGLRFLGFARKEGERGRR